MIKGAMGMYRVSLFVVAALSGAAVTSSALANETASSAKTTTSVTTTTTTTTSETTPALEPAEGKLTIKLGRVFHAGGRAITLRGRKISVNGTVAPYVAGQSVVVRLYRGAKKLGVKKVKIREGSDGDGVFAVSLRAKRTGQLTVKSSHRGTEAQATMIAKSKNVQVIKSSLSAGSKGFAVRLLQRKLLALHYAVPRSGRFDGGTSRAVMAYRKVNGMARTGSVSGRIMLRLLRGQGAFKVRFPKHGHHVEADLSQQVLALIDNGKVQRTYITSSGTSATPTVLGHFRVYLKTPGTNAKGMVNSSFFIRGYAVHGFASVPPYPASHGCLRVPVPNALAIFRWINYGDRVDVYR